MAQQRPRSARLRGNSEIEHFEDPTLIYAWAGLTVCYQLLIRLASPAASLARRGTGEPCGELGSENEAHYTLFSEVRTEYPRPSEPV